MNFGRFFTKVANVLLLFYRNGVNNMLNHLFIVGIAVFVVRFRF
nr:MAG TPA: hypothetical protein [Caudoviricetes sp.]